MLPRVATTTGTSHPSPALPAGGSVDATARPQLSTAALANLRADVLLRLIETMLKHLPPSAEANASRDLLETLLVALKTLPGREGENGRKLADILAKLPPELRPSVEKLISTVLSSMPTRSLIEIIRNPNGPEAQKLATLIATSLSLPDGGDFHGGGAEHPQKPLGLTLQQRAILDRQGSSPLSAVPARVLAEILRNPSGPEAQKLASLIATDLPIADEGGAEYQQKPIGLANQQLGIIGRQGNLLSAIPARVLAEILRNPTGPEAQKLASLIAADLPIADKGGAELQRKPISLATQRLGILDRQGSNLLSAIPARVLAEILRNPTGPEAQKLASLIAAGLPIADEGGLDYQQKPISIATQQLSILDRQGNLLSAIPARVLAEALRNPSGPEAQKLASLIAANLPIADEGGLDYQQKPINLATRQLSALDHQGNLLSAIPARVLAEILRNPSGPEAQKLAVLLASLDLDQDNGSEQKPIGATTQQAVAGRQGTQQTPQAVQVLGGDARALQTALKRIFDLDGTSKPRTETARAVETVAGRQESAGANRLPAETNTAARIEVRSPTPTGKIGDPQPVEAIEAIIYHAGSAEETETATSTAKREEMPAKAATANAAGQALARSVLQAVARDVPPALLMQAVAHLVENLSPEEASFLRALLERPLDAMVEPETERAETGHPEESVQQAIETETAAEGNKAKPETALSSPRQVTELDEALPMPARSAAQSATVVDVTPDRLLPAAMPRDGIPLAFVPYLPAEEDLEWSQNRNTEDDEAADEDATDSEAGGDDTAQQDAEADASDDEPESADMARKREKTAEMVGVIEPGLVFYQKLGDYWA